MFSFSLTMVITCIVITVSVRSVVTEFRFGSETFALKHILTNIAPGITLHSVGLTHLEDAFIQAKKRIDTAGVLQIRTMAVVIFKTVFPRIISIYLPFLQSMAGELAGAQRLTIIT